MRPAQDSFAEATRSIRRGQQQCAHSRALALDSRSRLDAARLRCRESADRVAQSRENAALSSLPRAITLPRRGSGASAARTDDPIDAAPGENMIDAAAPQDVIIFPGREPVVLLQQLLWELGEGRTAEITAAAIERFARETTPELRRQVAALRKWLAESH